MTFEEFARDIINDRRPVRIVSPHLDDAVLSCGNLMAYLAGKTDVEVWTVFTEAGKPPYTLSAKAFLSQCKSDDAGKLFAERRDEDRSALGRIGATWKHLGYSDALFRRKMTGIIVKWMGLLMPEITMIYPTYRFHITTGKVSHEDSTLKRSLSRQFEELACLSNNPIVFFPLGLGKHVDHVLLHHIGLHFSGDVVFYSDFPYCLSDEPDTATLSSEGVRSLPFEGFSGSKKDLIREYATQPLFQDEIPSVPEVYHVSDSLMKRI